MALLGGMIDGDLCMRRGRDEQRQIRSVLITKREYPRIT